MFILAISGSLRANSTNTNLLKAIAQLAPASVTVSLYEGLDSLPHFSPERDTANPPSSVSQVRSLLQKADAVIICTPEYIHAMPGALKNLFDWVVSSGEFVHKPVSAISAGPSDLGGSYAHASLVHTLEVMTAHVVMEASFTVPFVRKKLNANGELTDQETVTAIQAGLNALIKASLSVSPLTGENRS